MSYKAPGIADPGSNVLRNVCNFEGVKPTLIISEKIHNVSLIFLHFVEFIPRGAKR